jgi:divalent metal cation (Fe/Co/Zn/Cd) transporter
MTIKEFNKIKENINNKITEIFPEIERVTITAKTKD